MEILILSGALVGLAILAIFVGVARSIEASPTSRLDSYLGDQALTLQASSQPRGPGGSAGDLVHGFDKIVRSASFGEKLANLLRQADVQMTVTEYLAIWLFSAGAGALIGFLLSRTWLTAVLTGLLGMLLPYAFLRSRQSGRLRAFNDQLQMVLMQLAGSMRAGYGIQQALDFVAHEMPAPAGREFSIVIRDVRLGRSTLDALGDLLDRVPSDDLRLVVTAIRIHYEVGGNLAEILENVSETIRERVRIKGELRALTSQQRLAGYVLSALPVIVFVLLMIINPTYEARLLTPGPTLCIPIGAILMMVLGLLVIRRVVALEL
jgi:tight adherence protein B